MLQNELFNFKRLSLCALVMVKWRDGFNVYILYFLYKFFWECIKNECVLIGMVCCMQEASPLTVLLLLSHNWIALILLGEQRLLVVQMLNYFIDGHIRTISCTYNIKLTCTFIHMIISVIKCTLLCTGNWAICLLTFQWFDASCLSQKVLMSGNHLGSRERNSRGHFYFHIVEIQKQLIYCNNTEDKQYINIIKHQ